MNSESSDCGFHVHSLRCSAARRRDWTARCDKAASSGLFVSVLSWSVETA